MARNLVAALDAAEGWSKRWGKELRTLREELGMPFPPANRKSGVVERACPVCGQSFGIFFPAVRK